MLIDWHSHHTAPEVAAKRLEYGGREAKPDAFDSSDFATRVAAMDECGIDLQLVSQGAGLNADALPREAAVELMRMGNALVAERAAPFPDRLRGTVAVTYQDAQASADEIDRMAG